MRTALRLRKCELRHIAAAVAIVLAFATLPAGAGIVIVSSPTPAFTLDICHPLPGMDRTAPSILLARPAPALATIALFDKALGTDSPLVLAGAFATPPDPPPPKPRA